MRASCFCSLQSPIFRNKKTQQNLGKKHADQESKNKQVIEGIQEKDLKKFKLVRLILDRAIFKYLKHANF